MAESERITIRLGPLARPLKLAAKKSGRRKASVEDATLEGLAEEARAILAAGLGLDDSAAELPIGVAALSKKERKEQSRKAAESITPEAATARANKAWKTKRKNAKEEK